MTKVCFSISILLEKEWSGNNYTLKKHFFPMTYIAIGFSLSTIGSIFGVQVYKFKQMWTLIIAS